MKSELGIIIGEFDCALYIDTKSVCGPRIRIDSLYRNVILLKEEDRHPIPKALVHPSTPVGLWTEM